MKKKFKFKVIFASLTQLFCFALSNLIKQIEEKINLK